MASSTDSLMKEYTEASRLAEDINGMISERSSMLASGPEKYSVTLLLLGGRLGSLGLDLTVCIPFCPSFWASKKQDTPERHFRVRYEVMELGSTYNFAVSKGAVDKPNPKQGISLLAWSSDSKHICTRNDNMPAALWIWDIHHLELAATLVQKDPYDQLHWIPHVPVLFYAPDLRTCTCGLPRVLTALVIHSPSF